MKLIFIIFTVFLFIILGKFIKYIIHFIFLLIQFFKYEYH